jgi:sec-independent protein translocase protein TatA
MSLGDLLNIAAQIEGMEWIIILVIIAVLFLFGPSKLPELARSTGRALGEFHRGRLEVEREINQQFSANAVDPRTREEKAAQALGVTTGGKSELQLKLDIARSLDKVPDNLVTAAAQALGLPATSPVALLREQILKALNG